jgi:hypothetical protein
MPVTQTAFVVASLAAAVALIAGSASAAKPEDQAPAVRAVLDCRKIEDNGQRLACYDAAAAKMDEAGKTGDLVSLDREQRKAVRKQAFGFTMPSIKLFDTGEKGEDADKIDEVLASAKQDLGHKWVFVMTDGAVWRQIDDEFLSRDPRPGAAIVIKRAAIGSYMLSVNGQPGVRVHRDN